MHNVLGLNDSPNLPLLLAALEPRPQTEVRERAVSFPAADGRLLQGQLFQPTGAARGALLIGGATGVPQRFYAAYARWLARHGLWVLSFDYRGIGRSRSLPLARDPARMRDWGRLDLPAALDWLAAAAPGLPLYLIGHSVGGQMLGLMPNHARLSRVVMLASGFGYWGHMSPLYGRLVRILVSALGPALYRLLGYAPNSRIGWGEDLPRGVAEDWFGWCQRPDYYAELLADLPGQRFGGVTQPVLSLSFSDDPIATHANVSAQLACYPRAQLSRLTVQPRTYGLARIGHLHFFSARMPEALWRLPLDWLLSPNPENPATP